MEMRCLICLGRRYVPGWFIHKDGRPVECAKPCKACHVGVGWEPNPNLREVTKEEFESAVLSRKSRKDGNQPDK